MSSTLLPPPPAGSGVFAPVIGRSHPSGLSLWLRSAAGVGGLAATGSGFFGAGSGFLGGSFATTGSCFFGGSVLGAVGVGVDGFCVEGAVFVSALTASFEMPGEEEGGPGGLAVAPEAPAAFFAATRRLLRLEAVLLVQLLEDHLRELAERREDALARHRDRLEGRSLVAELVELHVELFAGEDVREVPLVPLEDERDLLDVEAL